MSTKERTRYFRCGVELDVLLPGARRSIWVNLQGSKTWFATGFPRARFDTRPCLRREITACKAKRLLRDRGLSLPETSL